MKRKRWALVVCLLIPVVLTGCGRRGGADGDNTASDNTASGRSVSADASDSADGPGLGDVPLPDIVIENGGAEETRPEPAPEPVPTPEPTDPTEEAFQAVKQWSCLPVYRDGADWSADVPPAAVSCGSARAGLFEVTRTATGDASCPTGTGRDQWSHHSTITGTTTTLCLNRIWVRDFCVLAEEAGNAVSSIGHTTAVDCAATSVPVPYNQVLVIAAAYQAPPGANASHCPTSAQDTRRYWSLVANDGATLVCFTGR